MVMLPLVYVFRSLREAMSRVARLILQYNTPKADGHIFRPSENVTLLEGIP